MDAKSLAEKLKITPKTVWTRAKALGITGTQTKIEGQNGRPGVVYSPEECDRIAFYGNGKAQNPVTESDSGNDDEAIDAGAMVMMNAIGSPLAFQFQAITNQLDGIEDHAANALAQRVSAMPSRIMLKTAQKLKAYESLDLSAIVGILGTAPLSLPMKRIDPSLI